MDYRVLDPDNQPRCRNVMTLAPLFSRFAPDGTLLTNAYMSMDIPPEHFWCNSDGYGFDTRTLAQLLRTNFRNLNPHEMHRPLWCNARDLSALLAHPDLSMVRQNASDRATRMNMLSPRTREILALAAGELYSASYQRFVEWIESRPDFDAMMADIGYDITKRRAIDMVILIDLRRRRHARKAIEAASGTQASEHMCEPVGIDTDSGLYRLLEQYKAGVASELLREVHLLAEREHGMIAELERRITSERALRLGALLRRYVRAALKTDVRNDFGVFQMRFRTVDGVNVVFDVRYLRDLLEYHIILDDQVLVAKTAEDAVQQLVRTGRALVRGRAKVILASIDGGAAKWCRGRQWSRRIRTDNRLLRTAATLWTLDTSFAASARVTLLSMPLDTATNPQLRESWIRQWLGRAITDSEHVRMACRMSLEMPFLLEFSLLDGMQFNAGYDGYESGLLEKLNGALSGLTCAQDLGGALCEALSVPYAPEDRDVYAAFQCDHTNIPPIIQPSPALQSQRHMPIPPKRAHANTSTTSNSEELRARRRLLLPRTSAVLDEARLHLPAQEP